jgi:hypothetical protein
MELTIKGVDCYGELCDNSNFHIVFADEDDGEDGELIWAEGNPANSEYTFSSWEEVVETLTGLFEEEIVEISAV